MNRSKLFCLTFAGGNAAFYNGLEVKLKDSIEVIKLEYAGHGIRHKESFYESFEELADDLYLEIKQEVSKNTAPYSIMGYSMGSISSSIIVKKIIDDGELPFPTHIFLAAHEPFSKHKMEGLDSNELDEYVKNCMIQIGDVSEQLLKNRTFWKVYLPIYRADYMMISRFDFDVLPKGVNIPTTVFYSETDVPFSIMQGWEKYFCNIEFIEYDGLHFFIRQHLDEMAEVIKSRMR